MRTLTLLGAAGLTFSFVSAAASAELKSEFLKLRYVPASDAEAILLTGRKPAPLPATVFGQRLDNGVFGGGGLNEPAAPPRALLPGGISSLASDPVRNGLSLTGTPDAIRQVVNILRLIDVPPRQFRMNTALVVVAPDALKNAGVNPTVRPENPAEARFRSVHSVTAEVAKQLRAGGTVVSTGEVTATNYQSAQLFWMAIKSGEADGAVVWPRVNGDGTVTVMLNLRSDGKASPASALRRLNFGETLVVTMPENRVLLLRFEALETDKKQ